MTMKHSNQTVREIFSYQVATVYGLFLDNFRLPKEIVQTVIANEISQMVFYFPGIKGVREDVVLDCDVTVSGYEPEIHIHIEPSQSPIVQASEVGISLGALDNEATDLYLRNVAMERVWGFIFRDSNRWNLDRSQQAILINADNIICIAMILYDLYKQMSDSENDSCLLTPKSFSMYEKDPFSYSIFASTVCKHLQTVYTGYGLDVYDFWILYENKYGDTTKFRARQTLRSIEDRTGFEDVIIPHHVIPTVFPDFHLS